MNKQVKYSENCECFFDVEIPLSEVEEATEEVYKEIKKYAHIPGFRPGNAPRDMLEKYHGDNARQEVLKRLIPSGCQQVIEDKKIDAVGMPEVYDVVFEKGKNLTFKAKIEIRPDVKLKSYKGLKVKSKKTDISETELEDVIKRLQNMYAQFNIVEEKRAVKKNDHLICDVETFVDGKAITKKYENMWLEADKEASMLGLGEHLIGLEAGQTKEIMVTLPESYPDKKFAGKQANFVVTVKQIKEKKLPALDDNFAKDLGAESMTALKDTLGKQLSSRKEADNKADMKGQILEKLLGDHKFTVPGSMSRRQYEILEKHLEDELLSRGLTKDTAAEKKKEYEERLKQDAVDKVRIYFILEAIADTEEIDVTEDDLAKRLKAIAENAKKDVKTVREYYENGGLIDGLLVQIREEKTLEWLLEHAVVEQIESK